MQCCPAPEGDSCPWSCPPPPPPVLPHKAGSRALFHAEWYSSPSSTPTPRVSEAVWPWQGTLPTPHREWRGGSVQCWQELFPLVLLPLPLQGREGGAGPCTALPCLAQPSWGVGSSCNGATAAGGGPAPVSDSFSPGQCSYMVGQGWAVGAGPPLAGAVQ